MPKYSHWFADAIDFALPIHTEECVRTDDQRGYTGCARTGGRYESTWADKSTISHEWRNPVFLKNILRPYGLGHLFCDLQTMKNMSEIVVTVRTFKTNWPKGCEGNHFLDQSFSQLQDSNCTKSLVKILQQKHWSPGNLQQNSQILSRSVRRHLVSFFVVGACAHTKSPPHP